MTTPSQEFADQEDAIESSGVAEIVPQDEIEPLPILDIRQKVCWEGYISPKSKTYGNAMQSALAAGYAHSSALNVTNQQWFRNKLRRLNMLSRAEKVFKKTLIMRTIDPETGREQADLLRIQVDAAKHITKTLGKDEGYSERTEHTGKEGSPIVFMPAELLSKHSIPVESEDVTNKNE